MMGIREKLFEHLYYTDIMLGLIDSKRNLDALKILQSIEQELIDLTKSEVKFYFINRSFVFYIKGLSMEFDVAGMYFPEHLPANKRLMLDIKFLDMLNTDYIDLVYNLIERFMRFAKENKYDFLSFENVSLEPVELLLQEKGFEPLYFKRTELKYVKVL